MQCLLVSRKCEDDSRSSKWCGALQGMRDSYGRLRQHLLEHLKMDCGSHQRPGNVRRPAVQQLLLLLLLGAILLLAAMVSCS